MISSQHLNTETSGRNVAEKEKCTPAFTIEGVDS